ncbi:16S rRNA (adenine(1518)-N(6)/adenine(1519)-N(6))-dimethyltransferase RsmA [Candidatus Gracilibacteria bacterium]|nr:16S rRNA (adenine(1518)-N(6)/adenine(1519)-N(6))-dimethyltransferase RsmA [Candidatus Gracilibacteria bacterium]
MIKKKFAKKSLGQNFLHSVEVRDHILQEAGDICGKNILEIGPGLGFLTTKLLQKKANVTAVELDRRAATMLREDLAQKKNFLLLEEDILHTTFDTLPFPRGNNASSDPYAIIANIPYNITSPLLRKIFSATTKKPDYALLMVQYEVAKKIAVDPKDTKKPKHSLLSLSVEIFAESEFLFKVGRENFNPVPKVDSAVIRITTRKKQCVSASMEHDFFNVLHAGFSRKRKKIGNVLGPCLGIPSEVLLGNIDPNRRAETLSVPEWITITQNFQKEKS